MGALSDPVSRRKVLAAAGISVSIPSSLLGIDFHDAVQFKAKSLDGQLINTESARGKIVLIQFWATWCPYCRADAPFVDKLAREFADQGLEVLAVDIAESKKTVTKFLAQNPRNCKVILMEDTNLAAWFSPHSFPHYVALDRTVAVVDEQKGAGGEAALRRLLHKAGIQTSASGGSGPLLSSPRRS